VEAGSRSISSDGGGPHPPSAGVQEVGVPYRPRRGIRPLAGGSSVCPRAEVVEGGDTTSVGKGPANSPRKNLRRWPSSTGPRRLRRELWPTTCGSGSWHFTGRNGTSARRSTWRSGRRATEGAVDREDPGGAGGFIKGIRFEGTADSADALLRQMSTRKRGRSTGSRVREVQRGGMEPGPERDRRLLPEGRVRPDEDRRRGRRLGRRGGITKVVRVEEGTGIAPGDPVLGNAHFLRQEFLALMRNKEGRSSTT